MRAEDLMIGDLVKFPHGIDKVRDLPYVSGKGICASFAAFVSLFPEPVEMLEPIPLTPEILEKNTTESNKNIFGGMNYALNADYFIENRGDRFCLSRRMAGHKYSTFWVCDIHYIHELQHALRLCGINLEIKL